MLPVPDIERIVFLLVLSSNPLNGFKHLPHSLSSFLQQMLKPQEPALNLQDIRFLATGSICFLSFVIK